MLFDVDVLFLWLGTILFIIPTATGLLRGSLAETAITSIVGIVIIAVAALGPEKKEEVDGKEAAELMQQYQTAGFYSFILAIVGGAIWLLYNVWQGRLLVELIIFLVLIQIPYLLVRISYRRRSHAREMKRWDRKTRNKKKKK